MARRTRAGIGLPRRTFLKGSCAAAMGLRLFGCGGDEPHKPLEAPYSGLWGAPTSAQAEALLPASAVPESVLEVFLLGGFNPWDTFYVVPEHGHATDGPFAGHQWWTFQTSDNGADTIPAAFDRCGGGSMPLYEPFATDSLGKTINLGPFIYPLRNRPDLLKRMRIHVMAHVLEPHEGALPLALTGHGPGNLRMCSSGAHFERHYRAQGDASHPAPYSYVIYSPSASSNENLESATMSGLHGAAVRPLSIKLGPGSELVDRLHRTALGDNASAFDRLVNRELELYRQRLKYLGAEKACRSAAFSDFEAARIAIEGAPALTDVLQANTMMANTGSSCTEAPELDYPETSLRLATFLMNHPKQRARQVTVMEAGLHAWLDGIGYDSHENHVTRSSENVVHFFRRFVERVNEPGENDPNKIDLDRQMVIINSEFGRSPTPEFSKLYPKGTGLDHWPFGYVAVTFGGYVNESNSGVVGAIGEDSRAIDYVTPTEYRAAMLLAAGIWPFTNESFRVSDIRGATTEMEAALMLRERILGYS